MDRTKVGFAEAEGKIKYPSILKWGEIDQRLRSALWNPFYRFLSENIGYDGYISYSLTEPASSILLREFAQRRHMFVDEFEHEFLDRNEYVRGWSDLFKKSDYIEVLDFITFVVRDKDCPNALVKAISKTLDQPYSPYRLSTTAKTIYPAIEEHEAKSLERDLDTAFRSSFAGSKAHLQSALDSLGNGDYRSTIRESINSVESAVRDFTGDSTAVLSKAVKKLAAEIGVHRALADAIDKLYAYSSDEKGIRHALVFGENEKVGFDEAMFFLSACTAFVSFLSRKKDQIVKVAI